MNTLRLFSLLAACAVFAMCGISVAQHAVQRVSPAAQVDWTGGTITATGLGLVRQETNPREYRRKMMARSAAMNDAYRNLAEAVNGIHVTNETTVRDITVVSDQIEGVVQSFVRGARPLSVTFEEKEGATYCEVVLEAPLSGQGGFAHAILPYIETEIRTIIPKQPAATNLLLPQMDLEQVRRDYIQAREADLAPPGQRIDTSPLERPADPLEEPRASEPTSPSDGTDPRDTGRAGREEPPGDEARLNVPTTPAPTAAPRVVQDAIDEQRGEEPAEPGEKPRPITPPSTREEIDAQRESIGARTDAEELADIVTGVLFDARGKPYTWNLFPEVRTEGDFQVFDVTALSTEEAVGYFSPFAYSVKTGSEHERTRLTPIVIEAEAVAGNALIISDEDGRRLIQLNRNAKVLQKGRVLFIIAPPDQE